ncbi:MAG: hypothetical protein ACJKTH_01125 [Patescibacteria group bacterium UBA2163]
MTHTIYRYSILTFIIILTFTLLSTVVFAEEHREPPARVDVRTTNNADVQVRPNDAGTNVRAKTEASLRVDVNATRARIEEQRTLLKEEVQTRREAVQKNIETLQARRETQADANANIDVTDRRAEVRATIETRREAFEDQQATREQEQENRRAEIMERVATDAAARIELHLDRFSRVLGSAIERMYTLAERLQARTDIIAESGGDTAVAQEYLDLAVSELVIAEGDLAAIEADLKVALSVDAASLTRERIKEIFSETREAMRSAQARVRAAHEALRSAFIELKAAAEVSTNLEAGAETTEDGTNDGA